MSDDVVIAWNCRDDVLPWHELPPQLRLAIARQSGYLDDDYGDSLRISRMHAADEADERTREERHQVSWDEPDDVIDIDWDYHPPVTTAGHVRLCTDCDGSPVADDSGGRCETCRHRWRRRVRRRY